MPKTNPHEAAARSAKVLALLAFTPMAASAFHNELTAQFLERLSVPERALFAKLAGVNAPSAETWRQFVAAVRVRRTFDDVLDAVREAAR